MSLEIKIQCSCGTRYKFEAEPVNHQMPYAVQCPNCGVDGTEAANAFIRQAAASQPAASTKPQLTLAGPPSVTAGADPAPPPSPPVRAPLAGALESGRKKPKRAYGEPNMAMGTLGAVAAGFVGMMVWYFIIKLTNIEFGIIAWGVGAVVGFGCRVLGGGYSQKLGVIAGGCALVAIVGGEYLATKAYYDKFVDKVMERAYETQLEYAKEAVEKNSDEEVRTLLAEAKSDEDQVVTPESITPEEIEKFRNETVPELKEFIAGRPTREEYEKEVRAGFNSTEAKTMVLKASLSLWTLLWLFLGVGSAYKLGTGETE